MVPLTTKQRNLPDKPTREDVVKFISKSARYGNLGLFVGAGFTKAVLNDDDLEIALSWGGLLEMAAHKLGVDYGSLPREGLSFPEIASRLCDAVVSDQSIPYPEATSRLKGAIAALTCWYPNNERRLEFGAHLDALNPAWVITTNYDLVLETLLTGRSIPLGPNDQLTHPRDVVPIYHLHGMRLNPEEIIITQEDYVTLFRPNEYRQIRLALAVKESTTLFLGYSLGDVNVLTALDWSNNVFREGKRDYPHEIIQVLRKANPTEKPYRDRNGILILETNSLVDFFSEFRDVDEAQTKAVLEIQERLDQFAAEFAKSDDDLVSRFIDDEKWRKVIIEILAASPIQLVSGFISLLDKSIDETWNRAAPKGAFEAYNQNLNIILDILTIFDVNTIPPALFQAAAYALDRVAYFIGHNAGDSWSAGRSWDRRRDELSKEMVLELRTLASQYPYYNLRRLLKDIPD